MNKHFDKIFCINLSTRKDKWDFMAQQFSELNLEVERFEAITGFKSNVIKLLPGEIGCLKSHATILRMIADSNWNKVLILEDDAEFTRDGLNIFYNYINTIPIWDMLYLGGNHLDKPIPLNNGIAKITRSYTTHAYAITKDFALKVLESLRPDIQIDVQYSKLHKTNSVYTFQPSIVKQKAGISDIQNGFRDYGV